MTYLTAPWLTNPLQPVGKLTKTERWTKPERSPKAFIYVDAEGNSFVKIKGYWYSSDTVNA